ncbi:MAG: MmgE/PrpD family protein [Gammaproteobacteria bacterium]|nr:MmgE/PrpD family protein [Gammaproteobacteria bacterium]
MSAVRTIATHLAAWAGAVRLADVPAEAVEIACRCLLDVTGVALAGCRTESARRIASLAADTYAPGPCDVLGAAGRLTAAGAALANGAAAHALDFDDNCYAGVVHGSATTFPAVLAAAQSADASGESLLCGFIAGAEVQFALGAALTPAFYERGWWNTAVLGAIGAAAGGGRVMGLDGDRLTAAIALAAAGSGGIRAVRGSEGKHYLCGRAAEAGVSAAELARRGASAPADVFEDRNGFLATMNGALFEAGAIESIGERFGLLDPGVDIKRFPTCYASHAAADAVADIVAAHGLGEADIASVICEVPALVASNLTFERPRTANEAQFSMPFAIAGMIVFGDVGLDHLQAPALLDRRLRSMMERVEMQVTDRFDADVSRLRAGPECASVRVMTTSGEQIERFCPWALGSARRPLPREALESKFLACATRAVDMATAARWLGRIGAIENVERVRELFT